MANIKFGKVFIVLFNYDSKHVNTLISIKSDIQTIYHIHNSSSNPKIKCFLALLTLLFLILIHDFFPNNYYHFLIKCR